MIKSCISLVYTTNDIRIWHALGIVHIYNTEFDKIYLKIFSNHGLCFNILKYNIFHHLISLAESTSCDIHPFTISMQKAYVEFDIKGFGSIN